MTTTYNEKRTAPRTRRIDRTMTVIPASDERRADAAPSPAAELQGVLAEALESARTATASAERELHVAEAGRARAGRALEFDLRPMTLDEAGRAQLRAAYAEADALVADKRSIRDQARTLADAVTTIADSIGSLDPDGASRLTATLAMWQLANVRALRGL